MDQQIALQKLPFKSEFINFSLLPFSEKVTMDSSRMKKSYQPCKQHRIHSNPYDGSSNEKQVDALSIA